MKCENCNKNHDGSYGSGRFCSNICARGFSTKSKRQVINEKVSSSMVGRVSPQKGVPQSEESNKKRSAAWTDEHRTKAAKIRKENALQYFLNKTFDEMSYHHKRRKVLEEQNYHCFHCGIDEWQGIKIILEVDHVDGDKKNNSRDNLRGLCPNCHSLTDTWRKKKSALVDK